MSSDVFDMKFLKSALDILSGVFQKVCDKKSSTMMDKSEFEKTKNSILNSFESYIGKLDLENSAVKSVPDLDMADIDINTIVLEEIRILAARTAEFQTTTSDRLNVIENKLLTNTISSVEPIFTTEIKNTEIDGLVQSERKSYAQVAKENLLSESRSTHINKRSPRHNDDQGKLHKAGPPSRTVIIGNGNSGNLRTISKERPLRKAGTFVSRLHMDVTEEEIVTHIELLNLKHVKVTKLIPKYPNYSSFHIETLEEERDLVLNDLIWPLGTLISPFFGRVKPNQILKKD